MKTLLTALVICLAYGCAEAQVTATWKGGQPGREADWHCAKNWSKARVPDQFTNVFIQDISTANRAYPVIKGKTANVNSLNIVTGAMLTIAQNGSLVVEEPENSQILGEVMNFGVFELGIPLTPVADKASAEKNSKPKGWKLAMFNSMLSVTEVLDSF